MHLPAPEDKRCEGDYREDYQAGPVLLAASHHFRGPVEDRDEVGVQAGAAAYGAALEEEEERGLGWGGSVVGEALAEALWAEGWAREMMGLLGVVSPEEVQEGVWFRHSARGLWWGGVKLGCSNVES